MKLRRKKNRLGIFSLSTYLKFLAILLGKMPLSIRSIVGRSLGAIFSYIPTRDRLVCKLQLKLALNSDTERLTKKVYQNLGETILIGLNLDPILINHEKIIRTEGWDEAVQLLSKQKGLIGLTAHTASWDLLASYASKRGLSLFAIGREAHGEAFQEVLEHLRAKHNINTIWRGGSSGIREIKEHLERNSIVAALIDQDTRVAGCYSQFFFEQAHTPTTLIKIAKEASTPMCTAFIVQESHLKYLIKITPLDTSLSPEDICAEYNRRLEALIKEYPDQWVWIHKRWRSRPSGKRLSSSEYIEYLTDRCKTVPS